MDSKMGFRSGIKFIVYRLNECIYVFFVGLGGKYFYCERGNFVGKKNLIFMVKYQVLNCSDEL